jgi:hypothetical protein
LAWPTQASAGFRLDGHGFTTAFNNRLQSLVRPFSEEVGRFRQQLNELGRIAWPLRSSGKLKETEEELLIRAWRVLAIDKAAPATLAALDDKSGVDVEALKTLLAKLGVTPKARAAGYTDSDRAGLFSRGSMTPPRRSSRRSSSKAIRRLLNGDWTYRPRRARVVLGLHVGGHQAEGHLLRVAVASCASSASPSRSPAPRRADVYTRRRAPSCVGPCQEADNWLRKDYAALVADMEAVFGVGRVKELFAPEAGAPGTKTLTHARS